MNCVKKGFSTALLLVLFLLVLSPVSQAAVLSGVDAPGRQVTVRVMNYNIHAGIGIDGQYDLGRIADTIRKADADIVGLEEVDVHWGSRSAYENEIARLADSLDMYYFFAPIYDFASEESDQPNRQYGVAMLSRYPIIHAENLSITRLSTQSADPVPEPAPGFLHGVVNARGAKVSFYVTHLDYRGNPTVREMQVGDMLGIMNKDPLLQKILAGDMNAAPDAPELAPLFTSLNDTWAAQHVAPGYTYPTTSPVKRIDDILVTPGIRTQSSKVLDSQASDHLPVVSAVTLTRGR